MKFNKEYGSIKRTIILTGYMYVCKLDTDNNARRFVLGVSILFAIPGLFRFGKYVEFCVK